MEKSQLFGRRLPLEQAPASGHGIPALRQVNGRWRCQRCQQWVATTDYLPQQIPYCRHCLNLGRLTAHTKLYTIPEPNQFVTLTESPLSWSGQLSPIQLAAAQAVKRYTMAGRDQLLWAVTGAGKTEIGFPALAWALQQGWRVAWTSPRVDVCLELAPPIGASLYRPSDRAIRGPGVTLQVLSADHLYDASVTSVRGGLRLANCRRGGCLPLATSPLLQLAVKRAQKPTGSHLYLTATPGRDLQRQVQRHQLAVTYLPLRYHGYLLPPIQVKLVGNWRQRLSQQRLPGAILRRLRRYQQAQQRYLLFVPHVADLRPVQHALRHAHLDGGVTVYAADPDRQSKVQAFRDQQVTSLITTTILERGVTFPAVNVVILGGDDAVFSTAALVQMAGRVGRHPDHPGGEVICYCHSQTRAVQRAQRMIRTLNRKGHRLGGRRP